MERKGANLNASLLRFRIFSRTHIKWHRGLSTCLLSR